MLQCQSVTSSQLLHNFTVDQLEGEWVNILSVLNDKFLVSCGAHGLSRLFIYSREGRHLSTITINNYDKLWDATWTPRGNIVYTTCPSNKVVVMSESGKVITTHTQMTVPRYLSVSSDDIIYLADSNTGVYQSTDDGVSWSLVFKSTDERHCWQVIKVTTDHSDDFWTLELSNNNYHLRVYSVDRRRTDGNVTWRDINVPTTDGKDINLSYSRLSYDGNMNIFLSDYDNKAVHVLSVNGQYHCQLLSAHHIKNRPCRLAVDKERQLLYVGQDKSVVGVFKLKYGDGGDWYIYVVKFLNWQFIIIWIEIWQFNHFNLTLVFVSLFVQNQQYSIYSSKVYCVWQWSEK